jgi:DNA transformation protein
MTAISTIRNLGPAMETALIDAGIANAETLREVGANAAYCNLGVAGSPLEWLRGRGKGRITHDL